jgi:hypothetical protein
LSPRPPKPLIIRASRSKTRIEIVGAVAEGRSERRKQGDLEQTSAKRIESSHLRRRCLEGT